MTETTTSQTSPALNFIVAHKHELTQTQTPALEDTSHHLTPISAEASLRIVINLHILIKKAAKHLKRRLRTNMLKLPTNRAKVHNLPLGPPIGRLLLINRRHKMRHHVTDSLNIHATLQSLTVALDGYPLTGDDRLFDIVDGSDIERQVIAYIYKLSCYGMEADSEGNGLEILEGFLVDRHSVAGKMAGFDGEEVLEGVGANVVGAFAEVLGGPEVDGAGDCRDLFV